MAIRSPLAAIALCIASAASAQVVAPPPPPAPVLPAPAPTVPATAVRVVVTTSDGPITLALDKDHAPKTTANFLRYVDQKRLDGVTFYRAMKLGNGVGLIQGGLKGDPKRILPPVAHEPTTLTGLTHDDATISLARYAPGTATADFFITVGAIPYLDADPARAGDNQGFAAFGHVVEGMDVVRRILEAPTSPTAGAGAMKGQMIAAPVRILTVRRAK
ncbi:peptidylprolyl isomerase [Sphingomonas sp. R86521]|uniref:peptidylprolyl isomerase n=1 Tax=Sphingomonas sp. R86521 TaxID=3093860 RepID=UPI0036D3542E